MSKELVIGSNRHETKVAILEEDQLVEVYFQRGNEYSLAGSIHKGRVTRVLPGMQSAFVDLGLERDTFLYVSDFFEEENEDIDTVAEEKPVRSDRRERGPRRNAQRVFEERKDEPREARELRAAATEPETTEAAEPEIAEEESIQPPEPAVSSEPVEIRTGERTENQDDRSFRGDRRGRRSRRRRQRGRGFPETKYAQPAGVSSARSEAVSEPVEETENARDVLILPGESLAKYRHAGPGTERPGAQEHATPEQDPDAEAEEAAIADEAEELELSEKVFSHHDDLSPVGVEQKIDEVKEEQPLAEDTSTAEESESAAREEPPAGTVSWTAAPLESEESSPSESKILTFPGQLEGEALDLEEFEILDPESGSHETPEPRAGAPADAEEPSTSSEPQSATVREQGGRYMHRMSRRMRRKRGGNRFGQSSEFAAGVSSGVGTGAAPALEPEFRRVGAEERTAEKPERAMPSISDLLKAGQEIIVQIAKEPLGQKGARITSHVALPGRYVVFMPSASHLGVSRKVASDEERQRLKRILQTHRVGTTGGFIVRTAGEGVPEEEIAADMNFLYSLWLDIRQKAEKKPAPALLHYDLDIVQRVLRDQVTEDFKAIWVDNEEMYENVLNFIQRFQPALVSKVKMYTRSAPIFDAFNITQELEKALRPKVWLKSGGYIVINQTEALVAIDINTGKYVGKSNRLEDTIVKTNTEAVKEIVRQIRLRDLGGIIVVDFIDMDERKNRQKVMQALEEAMRADKAPYKILQFNDFGLVAITRKRVKQSLERTLCAPCPYCEGAGYVKSVQTIIGEILVEAQKIAKAIEGKDVVLRVHPEVAKVLKASDNRYLEEIEEILGRPVLVRGDLTLHHEKFDLA